MFIVTKNGNNMKKITFEKWWSIWKKEYKKRGGSLKMENIYQQLIRCKVFYESEEDPKECGKICAWDTRTECKLEIKDYKTKIKELKKMRI